MERREARGDGEARGEILLVGSAVPADRNLGEGDFGLRLLGPMWLRRQPRKMHVRRSRRPEEFEQKAGKSRKRRDWCRHNSVCSVSSC
jgi:hypothetical protein